MLPDDNLAKLGWSEADGRHFAPFAADGLVPARVVAGQRRYLRVKSAEGEELAEVAGSLKHQASGAAGLPAVGDWVALRRRVGHDHGSIQAVLPRRTAFVRRAAGVRAVAQVLAANVDTVFLVMGLDGDFNPRRLERALVLAWESGASPVVLLNKADVADNLAEKRARIEQAALGVPVCVVAAKHGQGLEALAAWLVPARTVVLLGSSGVGKSTLVNRLLGHEKQKTHEVRESDQRGRHTTTHRELIALPGGALLIDTPGLRELQLWSDGSGLEAAFEDVGELATTCRFTNCDHGSEPGCAVRGAVDAGRLNPGRLGSYLKLRAEQRALEVREDPLKRRAERNRWKAIHKSLRQPKRSIRNR